MIPRGPAVHPRARVGPQPTGDTLRVGVTDYAQEALGDIVFVTLPEVAAQVTAGEPCGEVESTKSVSDVYAPVTGTVVARNEALDASPELVNSDPYGEGWMIEIKPDGDEPGQLATACSTRRPTRPGSRRPESRGCPAVRAGSSLSTSGGGSRSSTHPRATARSAATPAAGGPPMPFCTQCGHGNPDESRFCSNCGAALRAAAGPPRRARPRPSPSAVASTGGEPAEKAEGLSGADQAAVDALPPGRRCSSYAAAPTPAAGSCSTPT